jgi:hypothetical protein
LIDAQRFLASGGEPSLQVAGQPALAPRAVLEIVSMETSVS